MKFRIRGNVLMVMATLCPLLTGSSPQPNCCRSLSEKVWFKAYPHHSIGLDSAEVEDVQVAGEATFVIIRTPAGQLDSAQDITRYLHWRSKDKGKSWKQEEHRVFSPLVLREAVFLRSPSNPQVLYQRQPEEGTYFRSDDGGDSWVRPRFLLDGKTRGELVEAMCGKSASDVFNVWFSIVALHPSEGYTVFATVGIGTWLPTENLSKECSSYELGLYISSDGGNNWQRVSDALTSSEPVGIPASAPDTMYGHTRKGLAVSYDRGRNWSLLGDHELLEMRPLTFADQDESVRRLKGDYGLEVFQFVMDPTNPNFLYIVTNKGVLRSLDGGKKWCLLNVGFDEIRAINSLALNPKDTRELFVGTRYGVFFSTDRGCNFRKIPAPRPRTR